MPPLPWFKFYSRRWLDNKELRRCSPASRAVLVDLMCLAHEGEPYGYLADKVGPLTEQYMASRCVLSPAKFRHALEELTTHERVKRDHQGRLYIEQLVTEEEVRAKRAAGGSLGGNPNLIHNREEGREVDRKVNLPHNLPSANEDNAHLRARTRALSVSLSDSAFENFFAAFPRKQRRTAARQAWDEVVSLETVSLVMSCLERYLQSDEVSRGVVANPDKWLRDQAENHWLGDWPKPRGRVALCPAPARILSPTPEQEIEALRELLSESYQANLPQELRATEEEKNKFRERLEQLERELSARPAAS